MTRAVKLGSYMSQFPAGYASEGVSRESDEIREIAATTFADESVTIGQRQATLFQRIIDERGKAEADNWDGEGAVAVSERTVAAAISLLCMLPDNLPVPVVGAEPSGEISFEWYRDKRHLAVITVDGDTFRWAALLGTDSPVSGAVPFVKSIPGSALEAVRAVFD